MRAPLLSVCVLLLLTTVCRSDEQPRRADVVLALPDSVQEAKDEAKLDTQRAAALAKEHLEALDRLGSIRIWTARAKHTLSPETRKSVVSRLRALPPDLFRAVDENVSLPESPVVAHLTAAGGKACESGWSLETIQAKAAREVVLGRPNSPVTIALIESGVNLENDNIRRLLWTNPCDKTVHKVVSPTCPEIDWEGHTHGWDFGMNAPLPASSGHDGHGTGAAVAVAATQDAESCGVSGSPLVSIMVLKASLDNKTGLELEATSHAVKYAVDHDARVINISYASDYPLETLRETLEKVAQDRILVVVAAGETDRSVDQNNIVPCSWAASLPNVVCVTATKCFDAFYPYSNYGEKTVLLGAPGDMPPHSLCSADYGTGAAQTSVAAPYVSAVAAMMLAECPQLKVGDIKERLSREAHAASLDDKTISKKRLDAQAAIAPACQTH